MTLSSAELQSSKPPDDAPQKLPEPSQQQVTLTAFQQAMTDQAVDVRHRQHQAPGAALLTGEKPGSKSSTRAEKKPHVPQPEMEKTVADPAIAAPVQEPPVQILAPTAWEPGTVLNVSTPLIGSQTITAKAAAQVEVPTGKSQVVTGRPDQPPARTTDAVPVESGEAVTQAQATHREHAPIASDTEPQPKLSEAITSAMHTLSVSAPAVADIHHAGGLTSNQTSLRQPLSAEQSTLQSPEQLLTQQPEQHSIISAAGALEIGMGMGTHGWLRVRASLESDGSVATQLVTSTAASADKLQKDLPALTAYLAEQQIAVSSTVVHAIESTAAAQNVLAGDTSPAFSDAAGGRHGQQENQSGRQPVALHTFDYTRAIDSAMQPAPGLLPLSQSVAGGWLSVRV